MRIHKETPMFWTLFQLFLDFTLGILKGFWTEKTEIQGITTDSGQLKIALQGAGIHQKVSRKQSINNTVFLDSRIFRTWPLYAAERYSSVR